MIPHLALHIGRRAGRRLLNLVLRRHRATLLLFATITALASFYASQLQFEDSLDSWFLQDSEELATYERFREQFGTDEFIVVGLYPDELFTVEFFSQLRAFTRELESQSSIGRVVSLANVKVLDRRQGRLNLVPFAEGREGTWPTSAAAIADLRMRLNAAPSTVGRLMDQQGLATAVVVELSEQASEIDSKSRVVEQIRQSCHSCFSQAVTCRLAGTPVMDDAIFQYSRHDLIFLAPLAVCACTLMCFVLYRSLIDALAAIIVPLVAALWVLGVMGFFQIPISFLTSVLLMVILVSGMADAIHLLTTYHNKYAAERAQTKAIRNTLAELWRPCAITTATTATGFISLVACDIVPVRTFGWLAAFGAVAALVTSFLMLPCLLLCKTNRDVHAKPLPVNQLCSWIVRLTKMQRRQRGIALAVVLMAAGPCLVAVPGLQIASSPLSLFRPNNTIRQDAEHIDNSFGGFATMEFEFSSKKDVLHWEHFTKITSFTRWLKDQQFTSGTLSFLDLLSETNRVQPYKRNQLGQPVGMWNTLREAKQLEPEFYNRLLQNENSVARVSARVPLTGVPIDARRIHAIEKYLSSNFTNSDLTVSSTGYVKHFSSLRNSLMQGQISSFVLAAISMTVVLGIALRSWSMAFLSLAPNFLPIICGFGVMAACGIPLDPGTIMIASVALGLVVDDTCHLLCGVQRQQTAGNNLDRSMKLTVREVGPALCMTSLVLAVGFSTLMLGSFAPSVYFGCVMVLVVSTALLVDLVLVPILVLAICPLIGYLAKNKLPNQTIRTSSQRYLSTS